MGDAPSDQVFGTSFASLSAIMLYYGSRWTKLYDGDQDCCYFYDNVTGTSQWERPLTCDIDPKNERAQDAARDCLRSFYLQYNPTKLMSMDAILQMYKGKYTELFLQLAERYKVDDLSIFQGIYIEE